MRKSLIVAMTPFGIIGNNNNLPWPRLPGDLPRFRRLTMGKPCIMGRKTYQSIPKTLDGRMTIVVSRSGFEAPGVNVAHSVLEAFIRADESGCDEAFVIGGGEVYKQAIYTCDRIYLTLLSREYEGDTRLELQNLRDWTVVDREYVDGPNPYQNLILDRKTQMATTFITFERLEDNLLPIPRYATQYSAGFDFAACLSRPCALVDPGTGNKHKFWANAVSSRQTTKPEVGHDNIVLVLGPGETVLVPLGWKCSFDNNCVLKLYPRSSAGLRGVVLANGIGIIDPDYRGELFAALFNRTNTPINIMHGERIVQGVITIFAQGIIREGAINITARGEGGLGSTGQMVHHIIPTVNPVIVALKQAVVVGPPPGSVIVEVPVEDQIPNLDPKHD